MKGLKKVVVFACLLFSLAGCGEKEVILQESSGDATVPEEAAPTEETNPVSITYEYFNYDQTDENGNDIYLGEFTMATVKIAGNSEAEEKINTALEKRKALFEEETEMLYQSRLEDERMDGMVYSSNSYLSLTRGDEKVVSFSQKGNDFTGGAHGMYYTFGVNYSAKTGEEILFADLAEEEAVLREALYGEILAMAETPNYQDRFFEEPGTEAFRESIEGILSDGHWYFNDFGMIIVANPYDIAPYAGGDFSFVIPYAKLEGILKEEYWKESYVTPIPFGMEVCADLDGDGQKEQIFCSSEIDYETWLNTMTLTLNGEDITSIFEENAIYYSDNMEENYYLVDLDKDDAYLELAIGDKGMSDDYITHFYRYADGKLKYIGSIGDVISNQTMSILGDGTIKARVLLRLLETAYAPTVYEWTGDGFAESLEWVIPDHSMMSEEYVKHEILQPFTVYTQPDADSETRVLTKADGTVEILAVDNVSWVKIQLEDGSIYYIWMEDFMYILSDGERLQSENVLANLFLAG